MAFVLYLISSFHFNVERGRVEKRSALNNDILDDFQNKFALITILKPLPVHVTCKDEIASMVALWYSDHEYKPYSEQRT